MTATRSDQALERTLADVVVIDSQRIRDSAGSSLAELLRSSAGVEISQNGGAGALAVHGEPALADGDGERTARVPQIAGGRQRCGLGRIEPQMRMLMRALRDCGLGVSADDVRIDETTRKVTITLSWAATKQLTSDLQDIAEERPIVVVAPPDGPTLFDPLPPAGPVAPQQAGSGLHIEVPA